jgi:hypothetical protein
VSSRIVYTNPSTATRSYLLFVHSALVPTINGAGSARLLQNGVDVTGVLPLGCGPVDVANGTGFMHETAQPPGGSSSGFVAMLDASGRMLSWNMGSGVGEQARLAGTSGTHYALVGSTATYSNSTFTFSASTLRLLSNNTSVDVDGDGLSAGLEAALGTCDSSTTHAYCPGVFNKRDTDRDGLSDYAETFGVEFALANPLLLPAWGADPRQKDMFIEMDWQNTIPFDPFKFPTVPIASIEAFATAAQAFFSPAFTGSEVGQNADDLENVNGQSGIRLHLDIGRTSSNAAFRTLFGSWGGSNECAETSHTPALFSSACMSQERRGYFRYAYGVPGTAGSAPVESESIEWGVGNSVNTLGAWLFAHELGHSAGLQHFGSIYFGGAPTNGNPGYRSIMNYSNRGAETFSSGRSSMQGLNSAATNEQRVPTYPTQSFWPNWLDTDPPENWYRSLSSFNQHADWDFDDVASGNVRAPTNIVHNGDTDQALANEELSLLIEPSTSAVLGLPALSEGPGQRLFVFYVLQVPATPTTPARIELQYRSSPHSGLANGGCPNDDGWPAHLQTPARCSSVSSNASTFDTGTDVVESVALAYFQGRLHVAWRTPEGAIRSRSASAADINGVLATPSNIVTHVAPPATQTGFRGQGQISLSVWNTTAATFGANQVLGLLFSASAPNTYHYTFSTGFGQPWSNPAPVETVSTATIPAGAGVSAAPWPSAAPPSTSVGRATACAAFAVQSGPAGLLAMPQQVRIFCLNPNDLARRWQEVSTATTGATSGLNTLTTNSVPSLVFRPSRRPNGSPAYATQRGVFWLAIGGGPPQHRPFLFLSTPLSTASNGSPLTSAWNIRNVEHNDVDVFRFWWGNNSSPAVPGTGPVLYDSPNLGAMKGVWRATMGLPGLRLEPLADGTLDAERCDGNDWIVMARRMCSGLRNRFGDADTWCDTAANHEGSIFGPEGPGCNFTP